MLRYGFFYGPGTSVAPDGSMVEPTCASGACRSWPTAAGVWSFVHIDDVASGHGGRPGARPRPGIYNVVDDEPGDGRGVAPALAEAAGARPPRRVPRWLARLAAGAHAVVMMNEIRGA